MSIESESCAVVVSSSNNTLDVALNTLPAFDSFWKDCPFPRYLTLTSHVSAGAPLGWPLLVAGAAKGWRDELHSALQALPPKISHVLLFLDDFLLLDTVDTQRLVEIVTEAQSRGLPYVRLVPAERSWLVRLWRQFFKRGTLAQLPLHEPYYSSLQLALWERQHLSDMLARRGSIWEFEHQQDPAKRHFAVIRDRPCRYIHVVEKSAWLPYAGRVFRRAGIPFNPGARRQHSATYGVRHHLRKFLFAMIGYSVFRARRASAASSQASS